MPSGNTFVEYTATTGATEFQYTFPTLNLDHVIANVDGAETDQNSGSGHTFTISETPTKRVIFDTAPGNGKTVRIYRNTMGLDNDSTDPLVDFVDGSIITADNLDDAVRQSLYIAQEKADFQTDLADAANGAVLVYNSTTSKWEVLPLNLQYDSTNGTFGFGGTPATDYAHKFIGDFLVRQDGTSNGAVLTIENTDASNTDAVLILASYSPVVQFYDTNGSTDKKYFNIQHQDGTITFQPLTDAGADKSTIPLKLVEDGGVLMPDIPTSDPSVTGEIWSSGGKLTLSGGRPSPVYDSGWVTAWGGTTIAANANGTVTMSATVDGFFPFHNIHVYLKRTNTYYPLPTSPNEWDGNSIGLQVIYDTSTKGLTIYFQDRPFTYESAAGVDTASTWSSGTDQIRVIIS